MTRRTPPKVPRPEPAPLAESPAVAALVAGLGAPEGGGAASPERAAALVERFWAEHPTTPMIEPAGPGERLATFLWRDASSDEVLLFVNRLTDERNLADSLMRRVPGTDLWHLSYRMRADWRASYGFLPRRSAEPWPWPEGDQVALRRGLDHVRADPRNPLSCANRSGVRLSVAELPDAPAQPWLGRGEDVPRGETSAHEAPDGRRVRVHRPPSAAAPAEPLPIVIALDGEVWAGPQDLPATMDALLADGRIRPALLVMVDSGGRERRWAELDGDGGVPAWIADRLLPWIRERHPVSRDPEDVIVAGQSLGALTALRTVLEHPDRVRAAISQSASLWQRDLGPLVDQAAPSGRGLDGIRIHLEVGAQEWVLREPNRLLAGRLVAAGVDVRFVEYNGGHDYACWRGGIADGLRALLPKVPADAATGPAAG